METERLIIRNYKLEDIDDYFSVVSQPKIGPMTGGWDPYKTKEQALLRLKLEVTKPLQFCIELKENHKVIGSIELKEPNVDLFGKHLHAKEIGYLLSEEYWGKGIMPEAVKEVIKYAFLTLNLDVIYICHKKANVQSGRVQEKVGFVVYKEVYKHVKWIDGEETSYILRKMTKDEYMKRS